jgi:hypothetical protein
MVRWKFRATTGICAGRGGDSGAGTGVAEGSLLNGALVYFLGFPTANMASNEAFLLISDDDEASWQSFVLSYQSGSAVLIPAEAGPYGRSPDDAVKWATSPIEFNVYDSAICQ